MIWFWWLVLAMSRLVPYYSVVICSFAFVVFVLFLGVLGVVVVAGPAERKKSTNGS